MQRPLIYSPLPQSPRVWRHAFAAAGTVTVLGIMAYAIATGLAQRIVEELPNLIHAQIVKPLRPKLRRLPVPPKPHLQTPEIPTVRVPQINLLAPPRPRAIKAVKQKVHRMPPSPPPVRAPPPKPAPLPAPPIPAAAIAGTHTLPPYPPTARRLGREGRVLLDILIGTDGRVLSASVAGSSGDSGLDEAARSWVLSHWRYKPATQNGRPIAERTRVKITFNLSEEP